MPPRYWCVVPAAGIGKRMGAPIPKQYLPLYGLTVIEHTLTKLQNIKQFEAIVLCLSEGDEWRPSVDSSVPILQAKGGKERCDTVLNGLQQLSPKASPSDWVLVHDVARPCIREADIQRLISEASDHDVGGLLGMPVRDTMKRENGSGEVSETVCRDRLWHALTPQMFRVGELTQALEKALSESATVTDEASAMEYMGRKPLLVEGHPDNIKITHPADLALAEMFLKQQETKKEDS
ncbi:2-C-methyl-D-erythritol 4-phosphate cytidylyltransferase [Gammaproteobacteria bacterium 45_16_T64]|nr:2-C-methyl-D-erythritol 4-phosphate cytidylyltransferase [Gammaproteobacteria bacterium 45_16_T64]